MIDRGSWVVGRGSSSVVSLASLQGWTKMMRIDGGCTTRNPHRFGINLRLYLIFKSRGVLIMVPHRIFLPLNFSVFHFLSFASPSTSGFFLLRVRKNKSGRRGWSERDRRHIN